MRYLCNLLIPLLFISLATASPLRARSILTASTIESIAPSTASCASAAFPSECRTAPAAARWISRSFMAYGITSRAEQAALLALMLYESSDFQHSRNHWPGVPGQGTRNMQSPAFTARYAASLAGPAAVRAAQASGGPAAVLELVNGDADGFASAAWFPSTQCPAAVRSRLRAGTLAGWQAYLTGCVGAPATEERTAVWGRAMQVMAA